MTQEQMEIRRREFWPIEDQMMNDPLINKLAQMYIHGDIATLQECLFQMVKHCSVTRKQWMDMEMMRLQTSRIQLP
ncbi:MAG: hypothetical protein KGL39_02825 [Patescibacteria group bacterium]|nr:hypothetical protein [Patescibacteria group bacterium]